MHYDCLVAGAGPSGLYASIQLAKKGLTVLCLDKKQEIGVPKQCAEGITKKYFELLDLKADKSYCVNEIKGVCVYSPKGKKIEIESKRTTGYILERKIFEKELAKKAAKHGAQIKVMSPVIGAKRKNNKVIVSSSGLFNEEHSCNILFGCDGPQSQVANYLGLNVRLDPHDLDYGFQYEMALDLESNGYSNDKIHLFFGTTLAPRGYIWIFPKGETANVGIGIGGNVGGSARYYLDKWINSKKELFEKASIIEVNSGIIPVGGLLEKMHDDNLLLCGDAAHQVNPVHGGGIATAMLASKLASDVALKAFEIGDFSSNVLKEYTEQWYKETGNRFKRLIKVRKMLENLSDDDLESLADLIDGNDILALEEANLLKIIPLFSKKLISNPKLLNLVIKYLK